MRKYFVSALLVAAMGTPMLVGCDRTLHEDTKTTRSPNGDSQTTEQKTVQHPDGSVTNEKETHNNNPNP